MIAKFKNNLGYSVLRSIATVAVWLCVCIIAPAPSPVLASETVAKAPRLATPKLATPKQGGQGLALLKALNNANAPDLGNFNALRMFFNEVQKSGDNILKRANTLLGALSGEDEESARRISAAASLTLDSGHFSKIQIADEYRLPPGATGWDFGAKDGVLHPGFSLVSPSDYAGQPTDLPIKANAAANGSALADGVSGLKGFKGALENGVYRILILYPQPKNAALKNTPNAQDDDGLPFGSRISINGAAIKTHDLEPDADPTNLTGGGTTKPTLTVGVQGWVVVSDGHLTIEFPDMPSGVAIGAIIAEPVDISTMPLHPDIENALLYAASDLAPAAGPEPRNARQGQRFAVGQSSIPAPKTSAPSTGPRTTSRNNFGPNLFSPIRAPAGRAPASRAPATTQTAPAQAASGPTPPGSTTTAPTTTEPTTPAETAPETITPTTVLFEDRQILVKRSLYEGDDTLGRFIDIPDVFGPDGFTTLLPCETCAPLSADDPALINVESQLQALIGDWLNNPDSLTLDWSDIQAIPATWPSEFERAIVYEFDINVLEWIDVELRITASTGILVWLDSEFIFGATSADGFIDSLDWTHFINLPDLEGGRHYLQILLENHSVDPGFSLELRGAPIFASTLVANVPEPGALALLTFGFLALGAVRRRRVT